MDVPSIIVHNSGGVFSSLDGAERQIPSLSFLFALVHNSPIIHPVSREWTVLQGRENKKKNRMRKGADRPGADWSGAVRCVACQRAGSAERTTVDGSVLNAALLAEVAGGGVPAGWEGACV